ncbi:MAG: VWA-like domain-containing protein [Deltaproteobacteria bacterium]|nr:VWA-like domain-containing protein [Deltaproteobacteria bacterium]
MSTAHKPDAKPIPEALREKLLDARARLLLRHPFFGYLVAHLEDRVGEHSLETSGTDGRYVYWSENYLGTLNAEDAQFVLAHQAMHSALAHLSRREGRDKDQWDLASDATVNAILFDAGIRTRREVVKGEAGQSAEEQYVHADALAQQKGAQSPLDDHSEWDEPKDPNDPEERQLQDMWRAVIAQAREFGAVPKSLQRAIELLEPKRDWRDLLREGLHFPEDYRWTPTDRRFRDVLLPTLAGEKHRVVIAVDTSGSIMGQQLNEFWAELVAILRNNQCEARVLACDAAIQNEWDEEAFEPSLLREVRGGGGTSFEPVFARVEEYVAGGWRPEAVVYLTDLDGSFPAEDPGIRTLWVVAEKDQRKPVPFGEVVAVD